LEKPGKGVKIAGAREKGSYCWLARLDSYRARDELFDRWEDERAATNFDRCRLTRFCWWHG
jgi:hypothetical protein